MSMLDSLRYRATAAVDPLIAIRTE